MCTLKKKRTGAAATDLARIRKYMPLRKARSRARRRRSRSKSQHVCAASRALQRCLLLGIAVSELMLPHVQAKVEADATASISTTSLTVPAGGTMNFDFTITAPASLPGAKQHILPGRRNEGSGFRVGVRAIRLGYGTCCSAV